MATNTKKKFQRNWKFKLLTELYCEKINVFIRKCPTYFYATYFLLISLKTNKVSQFHELTKLLTILCTIYMLLYASSSHLKRFTSQNGGLHNLVFPNLAISFAMNECGSHPI